MKLFLIVMLLTFVCIVQAQDNLVRNGGFEEENTDTCGAIGFGSDYSPIKYWYQHIGVTPDYFKSCSHDPFYYLPYNFAGYQLDASNGSSYVGIHTYAVFDHTVKECLMTKLTASLQTSHKYLFTMFLSRRDDILLTSNLGFCLEHDSIAKDDLLTEYTTTPESFVFQTDTTIKDCENWVKFQHIFTPPSDGLQHLVIGNFSNYHTQIDSLPLTAFCGPSLFRYPYEFAYYLIDDVSLYCLDCDTTGPCPIATPDAFTPNADGINDEWQPLFSNDCSLDSTSYLLHIFDRWGNLIFSSNSFNEPWKGINTPLGTYVFYLQYDEKGITRKKQGSIELLR